MIVRASERYCMASEQLKVVVPFFGRPTPNVVGPLSKARDIAKKLKRVILAPVGSEAGFVLERICTCRGSRSPGQGTRFPDFRGRAIERSGELLQCAGQSVGTYAGHGHGAVGGLCRTGIAKTPARWMQPLPNV